MNWWCTSCSNVHATNIFLNLFSGLFHNAAMFSGSVLNPWAFEEKPVEKAFTLGKLMGIDTNNVETLSNFLMLKSPEDIVRAQLKLKTEEVILTFKWQFLR